MGVSDKRTITATFTISFDGQFLQMQLIYSAKTDRSIPKISLPNSPESIKLLQEIIILYIKSERRKLVLDGNAPGLLILDVFKGQTTPAVIDLLMKNSIFTTKVPANLTNLYQPLDITVNGVAKTFF